MTAIYGYVHPQRGTNSFYKTLEEALDCAHADLATDGYDDGTPILKCHLPKRMSATVALAMLRGKPEQWAEKVETVVLFKADPADHLAEIDAEIAQAAGWLNDAESGEHPQPRMLKTLRGRLDRLQVSRLRILGHTKREAEALIMGRRQVPAKRPDLKIVR